MSNIKSGDMIACVTSRAILYKNMDQFTKFGLMNDEYDEVLTGDILLVLDHTTHPRLVWVLTQAGATGWVFKRFLAAQLKRAAKTMK